MPPGIFKQSNGVRGYRCMLSLSEEDCQILEKYRRELSTTIGHVFPAGTAAYTLFRHALLAWQAQRDRDSEAPTNDLIQA